MFVCFKNNLMFIYFWLCWFFIAVWAFLRLQQVGAPSSCPVQSSRWGGSSCCRARALGHQLTGFLLGWLLLLQSTGSGAPARRVLVGVAPLVAEHGLWGTSSAVVAHSRSCPTAHGLFPDQGLNLRLLH